MTDYHRLDLSLRMTKQKKRHVRTWVFGVYNAYFHRNPYFILADRDLVQQPDGSFEEQPVFREVSILPIIPSISYQFKF
jgi:hypothetical protein